MTFETVMGHVARGFEAFGALLLVIGLVWSLGRAWTTWRRNHDGARSYWVLRATFGRVLLLGLEVLVAADLIRTVVVAPTLANVAGLGLIVLIRTLLSFSLEVEINGAWPWSRRSSPLADTSPTP